jgi:hypothetical protein
MSCFNVFLRVPPLAPEFMRCVGKAGNSLSLNCHFFKKRFVVAFFLLSCDMRTSALPRRKERPVTFPHHPPIYTHRIVPACFVSSSLCRCYYDASGCMICCCRTSPYLSSQYYLITPFRRLACMRQPGHVGLLSLLLKKTRIHSLDTRVSELFFYRLSHIGSSFFLSFSDPKPARVCLVQQVMLRKSLLTC